MSALTDQIRAIREERDRLKDELIVAMKERNDAVMARDRLKSENAMLIDSGRKTREGQGAGADGAVRMKGETMSDLYTSYETSLALRDAGAGQGIEVPGDETEPVGPYYWCDGIGEYGVPIGKHFGCHGNTHPRAFRADEIIEALGASLDIMEQVGTNGDDWQVSVSTREARFHGRASTPVEALAQAWLAVLRGAK